jgi:hypothetical protein
MVKPLATACLLLSLSPFAIHHASSAVHLPPFTIIEPETLRPIGALPAHVTGRFEDPTGFQQAPGGDYFIFDRRAHAVFAYTPGADEPRKVIQVGAERGRVIQPTAFDFAPDNTFVLADAPWGEERIQIFSARGTSLGGFSLGKRSGPRIFGGDVVLNGVGSLEYTGSSILISQPETGALVTEYDVDGRAKRTFGELRRTGQEADPELHAALNVGLPIVDPDGGFYFVFLAGVPMFRKYDASGTVVFERHVEGTEVDRLLRSFPTTWRARRAREGEAAIVPASVRTAAVDRNGNLWVSLTVPATYVYDRSGDKRRVVQFRAAGLLSPSSLFFTKDRVLVTPGCYAFPAG